MMTVSAGNTGAPRSTREALPTPVGELAHEAPAGEETPDLRTLLARPDWQRHAACHGLTSLFFPAQGGNVETPKRVCEGCRVRAECAEAGYGEQYGVWGGASSWERRVARRLRLVGDGAA